MAQENNNGPKRAFDLTKLYGGTVTKEVASSFVDLQCEFMVKDTYKDRDQIKRHMAYADRDQTERQMAVTVIRQVEKDHQIRFLETIFIDYFLSKAEPSQELQMNRITLNALSAVILAKKAIMKEETIIERENINKEALLETVEIFAIAIRKNNPPITAYAFIDYFVMLLEAENIIKAGIREDAFRLTNECYMGSIRLTRYRASVQAGSAILFLFKGDVHYDRVYNLFSETSGLNQENLDKCTSCFREITAQLPPTVLQLQLLPTHKMPSLIKIHFCYCLLGTLVEKSTEILEDERVIRLHFVNRKDAEAACRSSTRTDYGLIGLKGVKYRVIN